MLRDSEGAALSRERICQPSSPNCARARSRKRFTPACESSVSLTATASRVSEPGRTMPVRSSPASVTITRGPNTAPSDNRSGSLAIAPSSVNRASPSASASPGFNASRSIRIGSAQAPSAPASAIRIGPSGDCNSPNSG